jgi:hypothetical protein
MQPQSAHMVLCYSHIMQMNTSGPGATGENVMIPG